METKMKSETLEENRDRLVQMSQAEKAGMEATTDGQITASATSLADPEGPEQVFVRRADEARMTRSVQDERDEEAVEATKRSFSSETAPEARAGLRGSAKVQEQKSAPRRQQRNDSAE